MHDISTWRAVRFLFSYLKKHLVSITAGFVVLIAVDLVQLYIPRIIQRSLDILGESTPSKYLILQNTVLIIGSAILMVILRFLWRLFVIRPSRRIEENIRSDMFGHLQKMTCSWFDKTRTGDLMALFINDLNSIRMASGMALIGLADALFLSVMSLVFMVMISPRLTLFTILPLPLIVLMMAKTGSLIQKRFSAVQESFEQISSSTQEAISGIRVIKGFVQESLERKRFYQLCTDYFHKNLRLVKIWGLIFPSITLMASLSINVLFFFGGKMVIAQQLTIGEFVSFYFYIQLLVWPMIASGWVFNMFQRGIASSKRVLKLLSTQPDIKVLSDNTKRSELNGEINFKNLSFRYLPESKNVLNSIRLHIPKGSSLGIIGKPGSGKTTLVSLLFHFYPVESGCLFVDNTDINQIPLQVLRSSISYVPQDSFLFSDTIAQNIAFGYKRDISRESIEKAARIAAVHNDIETFSKGYDTRIGERGVTLSGGQKQRIALARALLCDSPVLILDDALSAVDAATEREIRTNMSNLIENRTTLIIAHRVSTVKNCDKIIVLQNGSISESGSHEELVKGDDFYARLCELQKVKETTL